MAAAITVASFGVSIGGLPFFFRAEESFATDFRAGRFLGAFARDEAFFTTDFRTGRCFRALVAMRDILAQDRGQRAKAESKKVGKIAGIVIAGIEVGARNPSLKALERLAGAFGVRLADLFVE